MQLHFPVHLTPPLKLRQNMFELSSGDNDKDDWKPALLIVELVMCPPQSNAELERFFSQMNYIKTNMACVGVLTPPSPTKSNPPKSVTPPSPKIF